MPERSVCYYRGRDPLGEEVAAVVIKKVGGVNEVFATLSRERVENRPEERFPPDQQVYTLPVAKRLFEFRKKEGEK